MFNQAEFEEHVRQQEVDLLAQWVDERTANHVLHYFRGGEGYEGGDFANALIKATCHADVHNKLRLAEGFPAEVAAVRLAKDHPEGIAILRTIAKGEKP